jgi:hypothetical protein
MMKQPRVLASILSVVLLAGVLRAAEAVLDDNSLWRYFTVSGPTQVRKADGTLEARDINWYWGGISSKPVAAGQSMVSPEPPAGWAEASFDDARWPRVRIPQPQLTVSGANPRPFAANGYATIGLAFRGNFTVDDPAQVQGATLSLSYWGGAVVYVNGKEVARGQVPAGKAGLAASAEDYPLDSFTTPEGKVLRPNDARNKDRLAARDRTLSDVKIPPGLLRKGVNTVAIEIHAAPVNEKGIDPKDPNTQYAGWPPIGLLSARLTVNGAAAARPKGIHVWNCAPYDTLSIYDCGEAGRPLRPVSVLAARNSLFSGRFVVTSDQPIRNLKVTVSDLAGPGKIPAAAVRVRCAEQAVAARSWVPGTGFDGLLDAIPAEIPVAASGAWQGDFYSHHFDHKGIAAGAVAPIWLTVRVPADAKPGTYTATASVVAEGLAPVSVPLQVTVSDLALPDPKDFRVQNFGYLTDEGVARHYNVPLWSDKHFALMGRSFALMAEVNSRQVFANLCVNFFGGNKGAFDSSNTESLIRWIRQPDGSYKYDFTVFDKYLDMVAKHVGKPSPLRFNCWGEPQKKDGRLQHGGAGTQVSLLDPSTGKVTPMDQPVPGTEESFAFWKPVLDEVRKRVEARGWWDVTALGHSSYCYPAIPEVVGVAKRIWPDGVWAYTAHNGGLAGSWKTPDNATMLVRYADTVWGAGGSKPRGYQALLKPRAGFWCFTYRGCFRDYSPLTDLRRIAEDEIMMGHDGLSDFGVDLFPLKTPDNRIYRIGNGRGTGGPNDSTVALLAPGPDGAIATGRFEMFREGVEIAEVILALQRALEAKKLPPELEARVNRYLDARGQAFINGWHGQRYMQSEQDEALFALVSEAARVAGH